MRSDYLAFGGAARDSLLDPDGALDFLRSCGYTGGGLAQSRQALAADTAQEFRFDAFGSGYCDFCFVQLMGGEFEELQDRRQRCTRCSRTVIRDEETFSREFENVRRNMEVAFGISLSVPMVVKMVNAKEIADNSGEVFVATDAVDPRVLGYVDMSGPVFGLFIENGAPRMAAVTTMAHELTHVWQGRNWDAKTIEATYGQADTKPIYEGMAMWAMIQYLLSVREYSYAERQLAYALDREDEYGLGFRMFAERYPLRIDAEPDRDSPFAKPIPL